MPIQHAIFHDGSFVLHKIVIVGNKRNRHYSAWYNKDGTLKDYEETTIGSKKGRKPNNLDAQLIQIGKRYVGQAISDYSGMNLIFLKDSELLKKINQLAVQFPEEKLTNHADVEQLIAWAYLQKAIEFNECNSLTEAWKSIKVIWHGRLIEFINEHREASFKK